MSLQLAETYNTPSIRLLKTYTIAMQLYVNEAERRQS